ncbi:ROK family transcriptional regulator [Anatilimnocola floriformis]|uniref:ROK family transcriptional regulator n=1 Tax=Anatilimnocola floriformis TaxID=2948575 RepID=UPI0020C3BADF|nr:ROK family transcriptional regulator [Anatilimnocola floriformis]
MLPPGAQLGKHSGENRGKPNRAQASLLRQLNTREVLAALQRHGPLSRAEIARLTGISGPTITRTVVDLLAGQLVEEGTFRPPPVGQSLLGRPGKVLRLARAAVSVQGVVIGVSQCELTTAGLDGSPQAEPKTFATPRRYGELVKKIVEQLLRSRETLQTRNDNSPTEVLGIGISIPGLLRREDKRTLISPNLHQTDDQQLGVDIAQRMEELGLATEVVLLQEMQALCLGEQLYGAAQGVADFAMVDIADGLGLGVVQAGQYVEGSNGLAGELGHITVDLHGKQCGCGNFGCLETVATDAALAGSISARLCESYSLDELLPRIQSGELNVEKELGPWLDYLSVGLAAVINLYNPSRLFVHGRGLDAAPDLFDRLIERTAKRALAPSLAGCELIRARGSKRHGAVAAIIQRITGA